MRHFDQTRGFGGMTRHAATRCKQRGIRTDVVNLIRDHFDRDHHAGAGAAAISISRQRLLELSAEGVPASGDRPGRPHRPDRRRRRGDRDRDQPSHLVCPLSLWC